MSGRIVVKIGSQVLCDPQGELNLDVLAQLAGQIDLRPAGTGPAVKYAAIHEENSGFSVVHEILPENIP